MNTEIIDALESNNNENASWVKHFVDHFKLLSNLLKKHKGTSLNKELTEQGQSDEEKKLILSVCEEIDTFYENLAELRQAKKTNPELTNGAWFEQKLIKIGNELAQASEHRNMTPMEENTFIAQVKESLDASIEKEVAELNASPKSYEDIQTIDKEEECYE